MVAKKVNVGLFDDIDGSAIDSGTGETIEFSVNGIDYVIDLKNSNANGFHRTLDYFIEHATQIGPGSRIPRTPSPTALRGQTQPRIIRQWAAAQGYTVSYTGLIPAEVKQAYDDAHHPRR